MLRHVDVLIIDLRENAGGQPSTWSATSSASSASMVRESVREIAIRAQVEGRLIGQCPMIRDHGNAKRAAWQCELNPLMFAKHIH